MDIMSLPLVMIENILSYLSFDEIAKTRIVSDFQCILFIEMITTSHKRKGKSFPNV